MDAVQAVNLYPITGAPPIDVPGVNVREPQASRVVEALADESRDTSDQSVGRYGPDVVVDISPEAKSKSAQSEAEPVDGMDVQEGGSDDQVAPIAESNRDESSTDSSAPADGADKAKKANGEPLTEEEQQDLEQLRAQDRKVRAHEQAHKSAGGQYVTGGPHYEYRTGPDGKRYAVGGSVSIDSSAVKGDPAATIRKMEAVRRAALAPSNPSGQDRRVAAEASRKMQQAMRQKMEGSEQKSEVGKQDDMSSKFKVQRSRLGEGSESGVGGQEVVEGFDVVVDKGGQSGMIEEFVDGGSSRLDVRG